MSAQPATATTTTTTARPCQCCGGTGHLLADCRDRCGVAACLLAHPWWEHYCNSCALAGVDYGFGKGYGVLHMSRDCPERARACARAQGKPPTRS